MRVICPYVGDGPHAQTRSDLDAAWRGMVDYRDVSASDTAYADLMMELWREKETFIVVEQDMSFEAKQLWSLAACPSAYCASVYDWSTNTGPGLGFTKFGYELLDKVPAPNLARVAWNQVDIALMRNHLGRTYHRQPHLHLPPVRHLNPKRSPLLPEYQDLTLAEHLAALGFELRPEHGDAVYVGGDVFGEKSA